MIGCACEQVPADIWEIIEYADLAIAGHWPVGRGTLNESASFFDAVRQIKSESPKAKPSES